VDGTARRARGKNEAEAESPLLARPERKRGKRSVGHLIGSQASRGKTQHLRGIDNSEDKGEDKGRSYCWNGAWTIRIPGKDCPGRGTGLP